MTSVVCVPSKKPVENSELQSYLCATDFQFILEGARTEDIWRRWVGMLSGTLHPPISSAHCLWRWTLSGDHQLTAKACPKLGKPISCPKASFYQGCGWPQIIIKQSLIKEVKRNWWHPTWRMKTAAWFLFIFWPPAKCWEAYLPYTPFLSPMHNTIILCISPTYISNHTQQCYNFFFNWQT